MAKKKKETEGEGEGEEGGGKKKRSPLIIVGLCVVLAGVGYMLGGRSAGASGEAAAPTTTIKQLEGCKEGTDANIAEHRAIDLPAMNINLTGGHFLRVTVSLAICPDVVIEKPESFVSAPAKDLIVTTLSGNSMEVLGDPAGREKVKELLTERIAAVYPEEVYEIYFLEFVMK
jgi:flagellar basal body-associated protein FliL